MGRIILKKEVRSTLKEPFRGANFSSPVLKWTGFVPNTGLLCERPTIKRSKYSEPFHMDHCLTMEYIQHAMENKCLCKFPCFPDNLIPSISICMVSIVGSSPSKLRALYAFQILGNSRNFQLTWDEHFNKRFRLKWGWIPFVIEKVCLERSHNYCRVYHLRKLTLLNKECSLICIYS